MPPKKTIVHKPTLPARKKVSTEEAQIAAQAVAYFNLGKQVKTLSAAQSKIKKALSEYVDNFWNEDKPHDSYQTILEHNGKEVELRMTARSTTQPKEDFEKIIKKSFPHLYKDLVKTETTKYLDMDALAGMIANGTLSETAAKKIVDVVTNFAFTPKLI